MCPLPLPRGEGLAGEPHLPAAQRLPVRGEALEAARIGVPRPSPHRRPRTLGGAVRAPCGDAPRRAPPPLRLGRSRTGQVPIQEFLDAGYHLEENVVVRAGRLHPPPHPNERAEYRASTPSRRGRVGGSRSRGVVAVDEEPGAGVQVGLCAAAGEPFGHQVMGHGTAPYAGSRRGGEGHQSSRPGKGTGRLSYSRYPGRG